MKKILPVVLALCLVVTLFAACGDKGPSAFERLCATWQCETAIDVEENVAEDCEALELFEDYELAYAPETYFSYLYQLELNSDNTYKFSVDKDATIASYTAWVDTMMEILFENREEIDYNDALLGAEDVDAFKAAYAAVYGVEDYDEFMGILCDAILEIYDFDVYLETGKFTIDGTQISMTVDGETDAETILYKLDDDNTLTLTYKDDEVEVMHKVVVAAE